MTRSVSYTIPEISSAPPLTIKGYLRSLGYSTQNLKILKSHPDGILLNNSPAHVNARLAPGDTLTVQIKEDDSSENILPVNLPLTIVYEDEDLLIVNKPAGMPTHPSQNNYENTLANALAYYFKEKGEPFIFRCIGRLDRDTSGLTIVAKHYVSAGILGEYVAAKALNVIETPFEDAPRITNDIPSPCLTPTTRTDATIRREYLAIVRGTPYQKEGTITAPLGRKPGSIIERCVDFENGEPALTHYQVLKEKDGYSLVSLILGTGRTHQIRIHMKHIGHPLIGDYLYNPDFEVMKRQALHSHRLSFPHPMTGKPMEFIAPLPEDMARLFS